MPGPHRRVRGLPAWLDGSRVCDMRTTTREPEVNAPVAPGPNPRPPIGVPERLTRRFGDLEAVRDLSMQGERGQIFGFLGPNGAGKTTTIKMLCGLLPPTSGRGSVAGYDIEREREQIKRQTGYMAQTFSLYPDLTVEENFRFFGGAYCVSRPAPPRRLP